MRFRCGDCVEVESPAAPPRLLTFGRAGVRGLAGSSSRTPVVRPPHAALPLARKHHERVPTLPPARPCCCFRTPLQRLGERRVSSVRLVLACKHCSHHPGVCLCRSLPRNFRHSVIDPLACASEVAVRPWSTAAIAASARGQCQYCQTVSVIYRFIDCAEVNTVRSNARGLSAPGACVALLLCSPWPRLGAVGARAPRHPSMPR